MPPFLAPHMPADAQGAYAGRSYPLGATVYPDGVNFCVFSKNCTEVELLLFDDVDDRRPARVLHFDRQVNRTFYYWHLFVPGLKAGQLYAYRVHGPYRPEEGHRFDGRRALLDPYARAVAVPRGFDRAAAVRGDEVPMKGVVVDPDAYDWEDDQPPRTHLARTVIYEMHVGGFTKHPSSGLAPKLRGTYAGLAEKVEYLKDLGVTAVELLPVQLFDAHDAPAGLPNYWGYSPIAFFAPHVGYSADRTPLGPVNEFRNMVKALHRAGIEVILDVVFNHTAEGPGSGPTYSLRGFENRAYYLLDPHDRAKYLNYTGCGNTINGYHSIVRRMITDCLHYWVTEMHVDGFRFDLASALARDESGAPSESPPLLWSIESDPVLAGTKLIAEAWDAGGLYQVSSFVGHRWAVWNGPFRDDVRRFLRADDGTVRTLANRLTGSRDLYDDPDDRPYRSINFITSHDGFTLNDLVSYNTKHNQANREGNRDGHDANFSWNCGVEGPTADPEVEALRQRQIRNYLTLLLLAQGTPMLLMGDEVRRTQRGNNNAYCQDNTLSWFDWSAIEREAGLHRFVRGLIAFTQSKSTFEDREYWVEPSPRHAEPRIFWHGVHLGQPDWSHQSHSLAFRLKATGDPCDVHLHVMINAYWEPLPFELPPVLATRRWRRLIDTALPSPGDFCPEDEAPAVDASRYVVAPRSVVVLVEGPSVEPG